MPDALNHRFLELNVAETSEGRGFWLDRPWVDEEQRPSLLKAAILAVPTLRADEAGPVFPDGTADFLERFGALLGDDAILSVAIRNDDYQELALHSKAWRLPTLVVTALVWPIVVNILSSRIDEVLPGHQTGDTAEATIIVESPNHQSLKVIFKGDPKQLGAFLSSTVPHYLEIMDAGRGAPKAAEVKLVGSKP